MIRDKATEDIEVCKSFDEAKRFINNKFNENLREDIAWWNTKLFEFEKITTLYKRKGETHSHYAEVVGVNKLFWPETEKEEDMVYVKFHGGKNGNGVPILKSEFEVYYERVRND